jgi:hypothetical protein
MKLYHRAPGDFTRLFNPREEESSQREEVEKLKDLFNTGYDDNRPGSHFQIPLVESPGDFTRCFGKNEIALSSGQCVQGLTTTKPVLNSNHFQATQIAPFQPVEGGASFVGSVPKDTDGRVAQAPITGPQASRGGSAENSGASVGFVVLLLGGLTICLHLEAILIVLLMRR